MKIVHGTDTVDATKLFSQTHDIDVRRSSFQQNINGIPDHNPRTPQDQHGDDNADQRIGQRVSAHENRDTGQNRSKRAERVRQHVKEGAPHIEAFMMLAEKDPCAREIREQPDDGDHEHPVGLYNFRSFNAVERLVKDVQRDENQKNSVYQGSKNLDSMKSVRHSWSCPAAGEPNRE